MKLISLFMALAIASEVLASQSLEGDISEVFYVGCFNTSELKSQALDASLRESKKRLGRLHFSEEAMEFSLKLGKDYEKYVTGVVFSKSSGVGVRFERTDTLLSISHGEKVWVFFREPAFDSEHRAKVLKMFSPDQ